MDARMSQIAPETVYDATGRDRISLGAWRVMVRELWDYRELIHRLAIRGVVAQFRQSFLGYLWIALPPVATALVFALLREARVVQVDMPEGSMPYPLFALIGATLWGLFTQVTIMATTSITGAGSLVSKIYFPREVLVLSSVSSALLNSAVRLLVVALTCLLMWYQPAWQSLLGLLLLVPLIALALGIGLLFAPLNAMMNDIGRVLEFGLQFGLFLAPTVYPTPSLDTASGEMQVALYWLHHLNPVSHFMYAFNSLMEQGTLVWTTGLTLSTALSFLVLLIGWRFFHVCEPLLAERL